MHCDEEFYKNECWATTNGLWLWIRRKSTSSCENDSLLRHLCFCDYLWRINIGDFELSTLSSSFIDSCLCSISCLVRFDNIKQNSPRCITVSSRSRFFFLWYKSWFSWSSVSRAVRTPIILQICLNLRPWALKLITWRIWSKRKTYLIDWPKTLISRTTIRICVLRLVIITLWTQNPT